MTGPPGRGVFHGTPGRSVTASGRGRGGGRSGRKDESTKSSTSRGSSILHREGPPPPPGPSPRHVRRRSPRSGGEGRRTTSVDEWTRIVLHVSSAGGGLVRSGGTPFTVESRRTEQRCRRRPGLLARPVRSGAQRGGRLVVGSRGRPLRRRGPVVGPSEGVPPPGWGTPFGPRQEWSYLPSQG